MRALLTLGLLSLVACGDKGAGDSASSTDADNDGWTASEDCDDLDAGVHPGATETCDQIDEDCDGLVDNGVALTWYADSDGDGYGDPSNTADSCAPIDGYTSNSEDCDDSSAAVRPGGTEVCDELDNDCDDLVDEDGGQLVFYQDSDGDGYGNPDPLTISAACSQPDGYVTNDEDCDDSDGSIYPGADEIFYDGIDQDCNEDNESDADGDGYDRHFDGGEDCDDSDPAINPDAEDICENGIDENCDGADSSCLYVFSGVLTNIEESVLEGWELCFSDVYSSSAASLTDIQADCSKAQLLMACRPAGDTVLSVAASAPREDVFTNTSTDTYTIHNANGVDWYYNSGWSWGFTHEGDGVSKNSCDVETGSYPNERLCWHTSGGRMSGGYRCGSNTSLNSSSGWERLVYQAD